MNPVIGLDGVLWRSPLALDDPIEWMPDAKSAVDQLLAQEWEPTFLSDQYGRTYGNVARIAEAFGEDVARQVDIIEPLRTAGPWGVEARNSFVADMAPQLRWLAGCGIDACISDNLWIRTAATLAGLDFFWPHEWHTAIASTLQMQSQGEA